MAVLIKILQNLRVTLLIDIHLGETDQTVNEHAEERKNVEARFLLKAKHVYKVSQSSLDSLIGDIREN